MEYNYPKFTPEMKKTHTILIPNMAITQFRLLDVLFNILNFLSFFGE